MSMSQEGENLEKRLMRVEDAVVALAKLIDPANLEFPIVGSDARTRQKNEAERTLHRLAQEIEALRSNP